MTYYTKYIFFHFFRASERGDSPWCSSLNHSYETLNMPDSGSASDQDPVATPLRNPHRPAPPVPAVASPLVKRKDPTADLDVLEVASSTADSISLNSTTTNRRKVKHPISRRTLRQRKIHSLKRQIVIKEKMLEVRYNFFILKVIVFHLLSSNGRFLSSIIFELLKFEFFLLALFVITRFSVTAKNLVTNWMN